MPIVTTISATASVTASLSAGPDGAGAGPVGGG